MQFTYWQSSCKRACSTSAGINNAFLCLKKILPAMRKEVGPGVSIDPAALQLMSDNFMKQVSDGIKLFDPVSTIGYSKANSVLLMLQKSGYNYGCQIEIPNSKKKLKRGNSKHLLPTA
ncbi:hypothetical protein PR048_005348 [Dryococelus australis]|uniref:Uncharacterized protein n=1 Tax=Dryococelus australis TaxID=614101 RepID=A0ABQ9I7Z5_9NEOP|nr:hypothetical protein PR048_005348 [Dryococelus australis]